MNFSFLPKFLLLLYCTCFLFFVAKLAVNLPYQDDVNLLHTTLIENDTKALILNLFSADSDHIQVFPKLAAVLQYKLFGQVNYQYLSIFMNFLVILALFFLVQIPQKIKNWYYFIPVFLMLLHPQLFEISFWVLPGLQHSFAFLFVVLSMFQFNINSKYNFFSIFWAACATFCTGNGLLGFFGIIFILILYKKPIWYALGGFLASFSVYLLSYKPSPAVRHTIDFGYVLRFQGMFWASPFEVFNRLHLHQIVGLTILIAILIISLFFSWKIFQTKQKSLLPIAKLIGILIFCGGTAVLISLSREYDVIFSRFQFYAFVGFITIYLLVLELLNERSQKYFGFILGGFFCVIVGFSFFSNYIKIENMQTKYLSDTFNWKENKTMMLIDQPYLALVNETYQKAENSHLRIENQVIEKRELDKLINNLANHKFIKINVKLERDTYPRRYFANDHYILSSNDFNLKTNIADLWSIVIANPSRNYLIAPQFNANFKGTFLKTGAYYQKGFFADIPALNFEDGTYEIFLLKQNKNIGYELFNTSFKFKIKDKIPSLF